MDSNVFIIMNSGINQVLWITVTVIQFSSRRMHRGLMHIALKKEKKKEVPPSNQVGILHAQILKIHFCIYLQTM